MKKASIRDVAKEAGVSITTVSRALNGYSDVSEATKEKIKKVVEKLNYAPNINARSLGGKSTSVLAFLVSGLQPREESGFVFGIISGLYQTAIEHNYEFILLTTDGVRQKELNYIQLCRQKNIEGVLISGLTTEDPYYTELVHSEIPCVVLDMEIEGDNTCSLSIDNEKAAYEAVTYLLKNGHRKIAMINGKQTAVVSKQRFNGYKKALHEFNEEICIEYIYWSDFTKEKAYEDTIQLLEKHPEITAIFSASDVMAIGVIEAIKKLGKKVPQDISVVGFDDIPVAPYINGGITTISQSPYDMGKYGGEALVSMIEEKKNTKHIIVPYHFVSRNTVKRIE